MSACNRPGKMTLRVALLSSAALAFVAALAQPADAAVRRAKAVDSVKKPNPEKDGFSEAKKGVQQIVVSIGSQRVTLFSNGVPVAQGAISTGMPGHPTPMGVFSIIQKDRYHHSNIYSSAPMPYMQRITWSGVAMHEGVVPGHPASHGCIRLTHSFAAALWPTTRLGVRVIVSRNDLAPTHFEHPKLFEPRPKPTEPPMAMTEPTPKLRQVAESANISTDARALDAEPAKPAPTDVDAPKPAAPSGKSSGQPAKHTGQVAVFVSRKEHKLFVRQGFVPLFEMPVTIEDRRSTLGYACLHRPGTAGRWQRHALEPDHGGKQPAKGSGEVARAQQETRGAGQADRCRDQNGFDRSGSARPHPAAEGSGRPHQRAPHAWLIADRLRPRQQLRDRPGHGIRCAGALKPHIFLRSVAASRPLACGATFRLHARCSNRLEHDLLGAVPKHTFPQRSELIFPLDDGEEVIAGELADFACKAHRPVGYKEFGFTNPPWVQEHLAGGRIACMIFMMQAEVQVSERNPAGFSAPSHVDDFLAVRQQRLEFGASLRSGRGLQPPKE